MADNDDTTPLRTARLALGWKQSRVIAAIESQAKQSGVCVAESASLKTMLSRWENGKGQPDAVYRGLFCAIYGADRDELGFTEPDEPTTKAIQLAPAVGMELVDYFDVVFRQHIRADNLLGPHHLVDVVREQTKLVDRALADGSGPIRERLLQLACKYNEFTGWLYQDAGDGTNAMYFSDRAMDIALEMGDVSKTAYLFMRKSNIANDLGKHDRALGLVKAGLRDADRVAPRVLALVHTQQARALAATGEADLAARAIDLALRTVTRPDADSDELAVYCTPEYIAMEAASCWTVLRRPERAVPIYNRALQTWPEAQRRDQGLCLTRLAVAHAQRGDTERACVAGAQAVGTVRYAASARALRELGRLRETLAPWRRDGEVSELNSLIKGLTRAA